jgi:hypothetical protein
MKVPDSKKKNFNTLLALTSVTNLVSLSLLLSTRNSSFKAGKVLILVIEWISATMESTQSDQNIIGRRINQQNGIMSAKEKNGIVRSRACCH